MSYSVCFICGEPDFSANKNRIHVERERYDKSRTLNHIEALDVYVCDACFNDYLFQLEEEMKNV